MEQEREQGLLLSLRYYHKLEEHQINIIDTPGHVDFTIEVERSMRVLDGVIAVFCSVGGAAAIRDGMATGRSVQGARIAFINKMDRMGLYKV